MSGAPVREGDVLAGKYRIERVLGVGGMGVVVAATHMQLDQRVALKFLLPEAMENKDVVARFAREARAAAKIQSEHVARVIDVGTLDTGSPYMVMEYLQGRDLANLLQEKRVLPVEEAVGYVLQACEAIAEAHAQNIVHRDLKPANLYLAELAGKRSIVKVLDFGISKSPAGKGEDASLTKTSAIMGSPLYMSPEQMVSSKHVDARCDIWALGVILYELLTGATPFVADSVTEIIAKILSLAPAAPNTLTPTIPAELSAVILRCLEKDPNKRYAHVGELASALVAFGPKSQRLSVERVSRVLGTPMQPFAPSDAPPPVQAQAAPPAAASAVKPAAIAVTNASWGQTGSDVKAAPIPKSGNGKVIGAVLGVCALVSIAGIAILLRPSHAPSAEAPPSGIVQGASGKDTTASAPPPPAPPTAPPVMPATTVAVEPTPAPSPAPSPVANAGPRAPAPQTKPAAPHGKPAASTAANTAPSAAPPPAPVPAPTATAKNPLNIDLK